MLSLGITPPNSRLLEDNENSSKRTLFLRHVACKHCLRRPTENGVQIRTASLQKTNKENEAPIHLCAAPPRTPATAVPTCQNHR